MSRIIVSRHSNGEERVVTGWDRPLRTAFVDLYDDEGECIDTYGPLSGHKVTPAEAAALASKRVESGTVGSLGLFTRIETLLLDHRDLDYPESNVVVDLTKDEER